MRLRLVVLAVVALGVGALVLSPAEAVLRLCLNPNGKVVVREECLPEQTVFDVDTINLKRFIVNVSDDQENGFGLLPGSTPGTSVQRPINGLYYVTFPTDVSQCAGVASAVTAGATINVQMGTPASNQASIFPANFNNGSIHQINVGFYLVVHCS